MSKTAKSLLWIAIIAGVVAGAVIFYFNLKNAIQLKNVTMNATSIAQDTVEMEVNMLVDNPFFFDFMLKDMRYRASLGGKQLLDDSATLNKEITDTTNLQIPVTFNYKQVTAQLKNLEQQDSAMLDFSFDVGYTLPLIGLQRTSLDHTMKVPVPQLPEVKLQKIDVEHFGFQNISLNVHMLLSNPNKMEAVMDNLMFDVHLNESMLVEGAHMKPIDIEPKEQVAFTIPITVKTGSIAKEFFDKITKGDKINVYLDGSSVLRIKDAPVDSILLKFDTEGAMQF